jgi:hypothetical protein
VTWVTIPPGARKRKVSFRTESSAQLITELMAVEWGDHQIRVNLVAPGDAHGPRPV